VKRRTLLIPVLALAALALAPAAASACDAASAVPSPPAGYLALYQQWGSRYGVPWQLLAGVGLIETRHGSVSAMFVPHNRGVLGPMQFQAGSNRAALRTDSVGDQGFGGTWALYRRASGHPPYRMDSPDDEIAAAAAKLAHDAGPLHIWRRALYRYNALHWYVRAVMRAARSYGWRGTPACLNSEVLLAAVPPATVPPTTGQPPETSAPPTSTTPPATAPPAGAAGAVSPEAAALIADPHVLLSPTAVADLRSGGIDTRLIALLSWIGERHTIQVSVLRTGHAKYVDGTHRISNHWRGRAATIIAVDGRPVSRRSSAAHALWRSLAAAPAVLRPSEIGGPWVDPTNPRSFSGGSELVSLHVGFDGPTHLADAGAETDTSRAATTP
jgi:hypothetical protein